VVAGSVHDRRGRADVLSTSLSYKHEQGGFEGVLGLSSGESEDSGPQDGRLPQ
jgi:hypothetical protein